VFEKTHDDSTDLSPTVNMDVVFYKIQCFITATQIKTPELTFICSLYETHILLSQDGNTDNV